jgi:predicted anti-sigma-YlaC factor YlaD
MGDHPTILELELKRTGEAGVGLDDHVASCAACRADLDFLALLARDQQKVDGAFEATAPFEDEIAALALGQAACVRARLAAGAAEPRRRHIGRVAPWAAAAAAVAIVAVAGALWRTGFGPPSPAATSPAATARVDDVNRDGRVDVLDAFALARAVEAGDSSPAWDVNRDGAVDEGDVEAVALAAVSLGGGGR